MDARLVKRYWNGRDFAHVLMEDFRPVKHDWGTDYEYHHSMTPGQENGFGLWEEDPCSYVFQVMERDGGLHILESGGRLLDTDLFPAGSVLSMNSHAAAFSGAPAMNDGSPMDCEICVDEYDPERMGATVAIRRTANG